MRNLWLCVALVALLFVVPSCDKSRSRIIGQWKVAGDSSDVLWEFAGNGRVLVAGIPGRYTFGDGRRIKIETPTATFVHQVEFGDDRMSWTDPRGVKMELTRVK